MLNGTPPPADPTKTAIALFLIGDVFVLPAIILAAMETSVQSYWWLLLGVPGLLMYAWAARALIRSRKTAV